MPLKIGYLWKKSSQHLISNAKINSWWIEDLKVSYQNHKHEESEGKELTNVDGEHLSKHKNKEYIKLECNTNIVRVKIQLKGKR